MKSFRTTSILLLSLYATILFEANEEHDTTVSAVPPTFTETRAQVPAGEGDVTETETMNVLDQISQRISEGYVYAANMSHRFTDGFTMEETETTGEVWVGTERYKVRTSDQLISVDGRVSTVFNIQQNKVLISNYHPEEDDFAPSRFIGSYQDRFEISGIEEREGGITRVHLQSVDPFEIITVASLDIDPAGPHLIQMYAEDQTDNIYEISFTNGRFESGIDDVFTISWPNTAEVIDLRE